MNICDFIEPIEEQIREDPDSILDEIVARHGPKIEAKSDEDIKEQVLIIKETEALSAIQVLCQYKEQQGFKDCDFLRVLRAQERIILTQRTKGLNQGTLSNWLSGT